MSEQEATLEDFADKKSENETDKAVEVFGVGNLPSNWNLRPLSESADIIPGNSPPSVTYNEEGEGLPFFQGNAEFGHLHPTHDTWCSDPRKVAERNDVLISIRAPVGDLNIADKRYCIGRGLAALRPKNLNGLYLFYHLSYRQDWLSRLATGSTFKSITKGDLQNLDIPEPSPEEQRKIASVLYTVDQAIQKTEEVTEKLTTIRKGLRQDIFTVGIDKSGELRPSDQTKDTYLGPVPKNWTLRRIDDVCSHVVDCPHSTPDYTEEGIIVVRTSEIEDGKFDPTEAPRVTEEGYRERISRLEPQPGDVIFTREAPIGKAFKIPEGMKLCLGQRIVQLRPKEETLNPDLLVELLHSDMMQSWFERSARGTTSKHINVGDIESMKIPIPSLDEQQRIDSVLGTYRNNLEIEQEYLSTLKRLKQGLMQDLLSGEVHTHDKDIDIVDDVLQHG